MTAFLCPTKSLLYFQPSRSIICAVGPPPFIAWDDTKYKPSGDHDKRKTCVVPLHSSNGSVMVDSQTQSPVRHIFTLRSSLCEARYLPTLSRKEKANQKSICLNKNFKSTMAIPDPM